MADSVGEAALDGLRVVEIGQYVAAPFAASLLAAHGAEVLKIERPGGDPYRRSHGFTAWHHPAKTSRTVDLSTADRRAEVASLLDRADVLVENLRPGALARLGLLDARRPRLVTCSITAYGADGPSRDDPGWEPLVHARAGAQQGLFTGDDPIWLPFPMASIAAGACAVLGIAAALVKRETTGYGQHVHTSLLEALMFLNAGAIFHREGRRPAVIRTTRNPVLNAYPTRDGRAMMVNFSGAARWRELCDLVGCGEYGGADSLMKLTDPDFSDRVFDALAAGFVSRTADEWEETLLATPAATAKCNTTQEWLAHPQAPTDPAPLRLSPDGAVQTRPPRHGGEIGALAGYRVLDISSFWAGPLAARLLGDLGADVVKVQPPGGEGAYKVVKRLPNIYLDANRGKRGMTLDLREADDRRRFLDVVRASDVVVENAVAGTWERLGLGRDELRAVNPSLVFARAKGFGIDGPLASRPAFDYVVAAATGMVMTQGGNERAVPVNFTANDYGTGLHLAAGIALALVGRARGRPAATVEASLMATAMTWQAEQIAALASGTALEDGVGDDLRGPSPTARLERVGDEWVTVCGSPAFTARSVHPRQVPDDPQVRARRLVRSVQHANGTFVHVAVPLSLSTDAPAIAGGAPVPQR